jgi:pyrimidine operon attenuation protein/uracil phosphoribosyltransferase
LKKIFLGNPLAEEKNATTRSAGVSTAALTPPVPAPKMEASERGAAGGGPPTSTAEGMTMKRKRIFDGAGIQRSLGRLALEIAERLQGCQDVVLIGIHRRGVPLARRLAALIQKAEGVALPVGSLDINLYRDDFSSAGTAPVLRGTQVDFSLEGKTVVLVDDVLFTGRTVRAALDALVDLGRPARVQLAVLVDRGHRELPIQADYVGLSLSTRREDHVELRLKETDGEDALYLEGPEPKTPPGRKPR